MSSRWRAKLRKNLIAYAFLLPAMLLLGIFTFYPIAYGTILSLYETNILAPPQFVGLENFRELAKDRFFWIAFWNSLKYVLVVPPLQFLSILLALAVNRKLRGITWFRAAYYIPVITSWVVVGMMWRWLLEPEGLVNYFLIKLGIIGQPISWLGNPSIALYSVMFVTLWKGLGYYMMIYLAGLQQISPEYEEAARVDGASKWQVFRHVTLPLLRPSILVASTISIISAIKVFEEIYVMTGGGPLFRTLTLFYYMFDKAFQQFRFGDAAAIGVVLAAGIIIFSAINLYRLRRGGLESW